MKLGFRQGDPLKVKADAAVFLVQENKITTCPVSKADKDLNKYLISLQKNNEFSGRAGTVCVLPSYAKFPCRKIILLGMGKDLKDLRSAYIAGHNLTQALKKNKIKNVNLSYHLDFDISRQFLLGLSNADHKYSLKSNKKKYEEIKLTICGRSSKNDSELYKEVVAISGGVKLAHDLVMAPSNYLKPKDMAKAAQNIAKRYSKVKVKVFGKKEIQKHKMGGLLAVNQGSKEDPRFIVMEYKGGPSTLKPLVFVGKGLTFDAGGVNIKTGPNMGEMKFDMGGGASVIGALESIAAAKYKVNVIGIVPSTENLVDANSFVASDVLTMYDGQTVEITNTDAEGRLILADALAYACKKYDPKFIVDLATLTGACAMLLGTEACGMISDCDNVVNAIQKASDKCFDRVWRLPLYQEHYDAMKSNIADMVNAKGGGRGAMTAAAFLRNFVDKKVDWAHLDIAGVVWNKTGMKGYLKGATGYGVQLLASLAKDNAR